MSFVVPPEWAPHRAMWLGFPSHADLWEDDLAAAQAEVAALARALAGPGRERVRLLTGSPAGEADARRLLEGEAGIEIVPGAFGDIWLRDTGPIFARDGEGVSARAFRFNGWGGKYDLAYDDTVAGQIAQAAGETLAEHDFVLEGGALDHDGAGTVLTTDQCLLNPNRNGDWTAAEVEAALGQALGVRKTIWLGEGLKNDHTDGHVDNLARFVAPGTVAVPEGGPDDPNAAVFADAAARIRAAGLVAVTIPSVGAYHMDDELVPASYMNWIVANGQVVVPLYGAANDAAAVAAVARCFPLHRVTGLRADHILTGGGSFHCISQQVPESE